MDKKDAIAKEQAIKEAAKYKEQADKFLAKLVANAEDDKKHTDLFARLVKSAEEPEADKNTEQQDCHWWQSASS